MALSYRLIYMNCQSLRNIIKPVRWSLEKHYPVRIIGSGTCFKNNTLLRLQVNQTRSYSTDKQTCVTESKSSTAKEQTEQPTELPEKASLFQRFKLMYKNYWYVVVPVHMATSAIWFCSFYYAVRSGLDVISVLESLGVSETLISPLRDSKAGYVALTLAIYKVVTPIRYAVTLGLTTFAIRRLTALGLIKPVPSKERIKEMIQEQKDNFQDRKLHYQEQMKEKRSNMIEEMRRYKQEVKNRVKKN